MNFAQIVFVLLLLFIGRYIIKQDNRLISRLIIISVLLIGIIIIFQPELTSNIAHILGIGRGTDLIFYMFIFISVLLFGYLRSEQNELSRKLTKITREIAIKDAVIPNNKIDLL